MCGGENENQRKQPGEGVNFMADRPGGWSAVTTKSKENRKGGDEG